MSLAGKTSVVTGGGRGIGAAVARALAKEGVAITVAARTREEIEEVAREVGGRAVSCDVSKPESVAALAKTVGPVDILVNNAGIAVSSPLKSITLDEWNRHLAVNATGPFLCIQAWLSGMLGRRWGRVINIASIAGKMGSPYIAAYSASKHAVLGLTRSVAAEVDGTGVTVNALCPGYVDTPMTRQSVARIVKKTGMSEAEAMAGLLKSAGQDHLITAEEVAQGVIALCRSKQNGEALELRNGEWA